jgi:hypothetical protein
MKELIDGTYIISASEWRKTHRDFKGTKMVNGVRERSMLAQLGGRGTCLVPVTVVKDNDLRLV